jgi:hypothetical protein
MTTKTEKKDTGKKTEDKVAEPGGEFTTEYEPKTPRLVDEILLYDADAPNLISFLRPQNGKAYQVGHRLNPVSDERFFAYRKEIEAVTKRIVQQERLSADDSEPQIRIYDESAVERIGYEQRDDWKQRTSQVDKIRAVTGFFQVSPVIDEEEEAAEGDVIRDDEEIEIVLKVVQDGKLIFLSHFFKEETAGQTDEFLAISTNTVSKNALASAAKMTREERLCNLYDSMRPKAIAYKSRVPAWCKEAAVRRFFETRLAILGKPV